MTKARAWRWAERALLGAGAGALLWVAFTAYEAAAYRRSVERAVTPLAPRLHGMWREPVRTESRRLEGILEIPRLHAREAIAEGDDDETLDVAVGHLSDTAMPWETGNTALAGHRDTLFRALAQIRAGDIVELHTVRGDFTYHVLKTMIVDPSDLWVLGPTPSRQLTLVTCYPFTFIGHAPHRFIVVATPDEDSGER